MPAARLTLACTLLLALAACGQGGPRGPGPHGPGARSPSPTQSENTAAVACRIAPYAGADGAVSRAALDKGLRAEFAAADADGDGVHSKAEISALNARRAAGCDGEPLIDWNGQGRMSYAAFSARIFTLFDRADIDGDGIVTREEMQTAGRPPRRPNRAAPGAQGPE